METRFNKMDLPSRNREDNSGSELSDSDEEYSPESDSCDEEELEEKRRKREYDPLLLEMQDDEKGN
jgi:hypothetical protein